MTGAQQLPLIPPPGPVHRAGAGVIRLLVFNAQHASPARARRQAAWIASQETADLVIITEVGPGPGGRALTDALAGHGYPSVVAPEPSLADYRTVIASRGPDLTAVPSGIAVLAHRGPPPRSVLPGRRSGCSACTSPHGARKTGATRLSAPSSAPLPKPCPPSWPCSMARSSSPET